MTVRRLFAVAGVLACVGCGGAADESGSGAAGIAPGIGADTLMAGIERLASDEFGGRAPGSAGRPSPSTT